MLLHDIVRPKHLIPCAISLYPLGVRFWKVGSRKIYAINMNTHTRADRGKGRKHPPEEASTSDSEEDFIPAKKRTISSGLASLTKEVSLVRKELQHLFEINRLTKIPVALHCKLSDTFKCHICQCPIAPPVIFARCCKNILGCSSCVDTWYGGEDGMSKSCPLCRTERALPETTRLHGLDDFLSAVQPLLTDSPLHE